MKKTDFSNIMNEFLRYAVIGGISFVIDAGTLAFFREIIFHAGGSEIVMAVSVAAGFITGLIANYILSLIFVFRSSAQQEKGKTVKAFIVYALVGIIGFWLTELGMYIGVKIVGSAGFWYLLVKCVVAGIVLIWNYVGRKVFVFKGV